MEVDRLISNFDDIDSLNNDIDQLVGKIRVQLGTKSSSGNTDKDRLFDSFLADLEALQKLKRFLPGKLIPFGDDTRMHLLLHESLRLLHHLSNQQHVGGGSVSDDVVLGGGRASDHACCWVLDLHLVKQDASVFGELDLSGTSDQHLKGTLGTEIGLHDFLQAHSRVDVHSEGLDLLQHLRLGVQELYIRHGIKSLQTTRFKNI